jgi:hypothetical protein
VTYIPLSPTPFFQEYDITKFMSEKDSHTIIERTLQSGNRMEIKWLFSTYSQEEIKTWVEYFGKDKLPQPHLNFWKIIFNINS